MLLLLLNRSLLTLFLFSSVKPLVRWLSRCSFAALLGFTAVPAFAVEPMRAHYIDVGQGAATFLEFPCGTMLIDAGGEATDHFFSYLEAVFSRRPDLRRTIDLLVLTVPQKDHTSFLPEMAARYRIRSFVHNGQIMESGADDVRATVEALRAANVPVIVPTEDALGNSGLTAPDIISCSPVDPVIRILSAAHPNPPADWQDLDYQDGGNHSLAVRVEYGDSSFLFPGDLKNPGIDWLRARWNRSCLLDSDILQVSRHGSPKGTTYEFLEAASPQIALTNLCRSLGYEGSVFSRWPWNASPGYGKYACTGPHRVQSRTYSGDGSGAPQL